LRYHMSRVHLFFPPLNCPGRPRPFFSPPGRGPSEPIPGTRPLGGVRYPGLALLPGASAPIASTDLIEGGRETEEPRFAGRFAFGRTEARGQDPLSRGPSPSS